MESGLHGTYCHRRYNSFKTTDRVIKHQKIEIKFHYFICTFSINNLVFFSSFLNGVYKLQNNITQEKFQIYCHMTEIPGCGPGGWTLVVKVDGNKVKPNMHSCIDVLILSRVVTEKFHCVYNSIFL